MSLCSRLKEARKTAGMTQDQLANALGIAKTTVSGYETGHREPEMAILYKIMKILNVDANYLFQDEMRELERFENLSHDEREIITKIRRLDNHGKRVVTMLLDEEYIRCTAEEEGSKVVEITLERGSGKLVARNGRDLTQDDKDEILSIARRWKNEHSEE